MAHSISNSNTFLAYFNHIDKFFEVVLWLDAYMPFTEKVDRISQGRYPVTAFVRKYQHKLKYFGDLRNQVVHGFRLEQHHYLLASDYAIEQIKKIYEHLTKPPTIERWCAQDIPSVHPTTTMREVLQLLETHDLPGLPIIDEKAVYQTTLFLRDVVLATAHEGFLETPISDWARSRSKQAIFMPSDASVYEIEWLFSVARDEEKHNELVWVTETGHPDEPIKGIITPADLRKLDQEVIL